MKAIISMFFVLNGLLFTQQLFAQEKCVCQTCNGEGMAWEDERRQCHFCTDGFNTCGTCKGDGTEPCYRCNETGIVQLTCSVCNGAGKVNEEACGQCGGDGLEDHTCANCEGRGEFNCHSCGTAGRFQCTMCDGDGWKLWKNTCPECNGSGEVVCP